MAAISIRKISISFLDPAASLWWATGFCVAVCALQLLPESALAALRYERLAVAAGEWWRLLSGNFVHLTWGHTLLNVGALLLGSWVFSEARPAWSWALAVVLTGLASSLGLYWFSPGIYWCVGLSGALHGLLIVAAADWALQGDRIGLGLLAIWVGKIAWEQLGGSLPLTAEISGAEVVTDAHLWGAIGGALFAAGAWLWRRTHRRV